MDGRFAHKGVDHSKWTSDLDRSKVALGVELHWASGLYQKLCDL
jgi:hypothetical protein